jgi:hypothetical protein
MKDKGDFSDFTEGKAAKFLKEKHGLRFNLTEPELELGDNLSIDRKDIEELSNGAFTYSKGDTQVLLFWYVRKRYMPKSGKPKSWPVYHIVNCSTMQEYSGFSQANKMPVTIMDRGKPVSRELVLCKNCRNEIFQKNFFTRYGSVSEQWYDVILTIVEKTPEEEMIYLTNGYAALWPQISTAYRESVGWCCESSGCRIRLSDPDQRKFLHTHHLKGTKNNRRENLQALCLLCHAMEHEDKMMKGTSSFNVETFVELFRGQLISHKVARFEQLKEQRDNRFA